MKEVKGYQIMKNNNHLGWESLNDYDRGLIKPFIYAFAATGIISLFSSSYPDNIIFFSTIALFGIIIILWISYRIKIPDRGYRLKEVLSEKDIVATNENEKIEYLGRMIENLLKNKNIEYEIEKKITRLLKGITFIIPNYNVKLVLCHSYRYGIQAGYRLFVFPIKKQKPKNLMKLLSIIDDIKLDEGNSDIDF
jgi:hypothetical protein